MEQLERVAEAVGNLSDAEIRRLLRRKGGSRCSGCGQKPGKRGGGREGSSSYYETQRSPRSYTYDQQDEEAYEYEYYDDYEGGEDDGSGGRPLPARGARQAEGPTIGQVHSGEQEYEYYYEEPSAATVADRFRYDKFVSEWEKQTKGVNVDHLLRGITNSRLARLGRRQDRNLAKYDSLPELLDIKTEPNRLRCPPAAARPSGAHRAAAAAERAARERLSMWSRYGLSREEQRRAAELMYATTCPTAQLRLDPAA